MVEVLALITARGGSKGVPHKNIRLLGGKPLIAWTIEAARNAPVVTRTVISTDDMAIAEVAREHGAEVPFMRPADLATDMAGHVPVVLHALDWLRDELGWTPDYVLTLQPTSPFRTAEDITGAVELAERHHARAVIGVTEARTHPYLTLRVADGGTLAPLLSQDTLRLRRQDYPLVYQINGAIYLNRPQFLAADQTFFPDQQTYPYVMPEERSIDIDTAWDFQLAELILADRLSNARDHD